jgi:hypothetical protein
VVTPPLRSRAEVLRACLSLLAGWPVVNLNEMRDLLPRRLTMDDFGLIDEAQADNIALVTACLAFEQELFDTEFATLEHLLALCQSGKGSGLGRYPHFGGHVEAATPVTWKKRILPPPSPPSLSS